MTSSSDRHCSPRFPTPGVLLDTSALVRLDKCEALSVLADTVPLHIATHVQKEFNAQGPAERAELARLRAQPHRVGPTTRYWDTYSRIRGNIHSTRDLGEDESLAVAIVHSGEGTLLPFVTYDAGATRDAARDGIVTMDFLDTLAWLVGCGALTIEQAQHIEVLATYLDGWKRPAGFAGDIEAIREARQEAVVRRIDAWRATLEAGT